MILRWRKHIAWAIVLGVILVISWTVVSFFLFDEQPEGQSVKRTGAQTRTSRPSGQTSNEPNVLIGNVVPVREATVSAELSGTVQTLRIREGDRIKPNEVPDETNLGRQLNGGPVKTVNGSLKINGKDVPPYSPEQILLKLDTSKIRKRVRERFLQYKQAELILEKSRRDADDIREAYEKGGKGGAYSRKDLDDAEHRVQINKKKQQLARLRYRRSLENFYDAYVTAPFPGTIRNVHVETGESVQAGTPLFTIMDLSSVEVEFYVTETMLSRVDTSDKLSFTVDSVEKQKETYSGTVERISPAKDKKYHRYRVVLSLKNPGRTLYPDMICRIRLPN